MLCKKRPHDHILPVQDCNWWKPFPAQDRVMAWSISSYTDSIPETQSLSNSVALPSTFGHPSFTIISSSVHPSPRLSSVSQKFLFCKTMGKQRWTPTSAQLQVLEFIYDQGDTTPIKSRIMEIVSELSLYGSASEVQIYNWFKSRRARFKRFTKLQASKEKNKVIVSTASTRLRRSRRYFESTGSIDECMSELSHTFVGESSDVNMEPENESEDGVHSVSETIDIRTFDKSVLLHTGGTGPDVRCSHWLGCVED
ncbi:unnamed protein product [Fraxinus pennsylvanica]|uniref:Homeobox domain-containing protein n=1 Tax=Fraxinus pennsylvanica TaxID=56036 RepID=A0AAD2A9U6_9LAMI|nr:unnamed protein product [Fraxinus pennsylvanica]